MNRKERALLKKLLAKQERERKKKAARRRGPETASQRAKRGWRTRRANEKKKKLERERRALAAKKRAAERKRKTKEKKVETVRGRRRFQAWSELSDIIKRMKEEIEHGIGVDVNLSTKETYAEYAGEKAKHAHLVGKKELLNILEEIQKEEGLGGMNWNIVYV